MNITVKRFAALVGLVGLIAGTAMFFVWYSFNVTFAAQTYSAPTLKDSLVHLNFFTATTTTATSTNVADTASRTVRLDGAKKATFYFSRGDTTGQGNTGSTNFRVQVSNNGSTWHDYNKLVQNLATSSTPTTLSSITISAATSTVIASMDLIHDVFRFARCIANETTDGEHSCDVTVEY